MHYFAIAGTLQNTDYYQRDDSVEHGQWRKLSSVFYPARFRFPQYDIAVVVRNKLRTDSERPRAVEDSRYHRGVDKLIVSPLSIGK